MRTDIRKSLVYLLWVVAMMGLVACDSQKKTEHSGKKKVLTSFTIIADMARNVAGDAADVESLVKAGAEIHGYEPTPKDIVRAQQADLVLWNGMNLEAWFEDFFQNVKDVPTCIVSQGIEPLGITEGPYQGKPNPHAWMSPSNALVYVENIRKALVEMDPANQATYDANAKAYADKIKAVDAPAREKLKAIPTQQRWLTTSEGAFSYLCKDYDMQQLFLWPINADAQGVPQQVQQVIDRVREHKIPVVFTESTVSDKPMRQVAKETASRFGGVLYVDSLTDEQGPAPTYLKMLEVNIDTIVKGFFPQ